MTEKDQKIVSLGQRLTAANSRERAARDCLASGGGVSDRYDCIQASVA